MNQDDARNLEVLGLALMTFSPNHGLLKKLRSVDDVHELRRYILQSQPSEELVVHLTDLIWKRVEEQKRRNLESALRILKLLLRDMDETALSTGTVNRLFELYVHFIEDRLDEIKWSTSSILKNRKLNVANISWLIDNERKSVHFLNRLLRYPKHSQAITAWAEQNVERPDLADRKSELLARRIHTDTNLSNLPGTQAQIVWAAYYAPISTNGKEKLLTDYVRTEGIQDPEHLIEVCLRLRIKRPLEALRIRLLAGTEPRSRP